MKRKRAPVKSPTRRCALRAAGRSGLPRQEEDVIDVAVRSASPSRFGRSFLSAPFPCGVRSGSDARIENWNMPEGAIEDRL